MLPAQLAVVIKKIAIGFQYPVRLTGLGASSQWHCLTFDTCHCLCQALQTSPLSITKSHFFTRHMLVQQNLRGLM